MIEIRDGMPRHPDFRLAHPVNFILYKGQHLAVCGPNGGGKSFFIDILRNARALQGSSPRYDFSPSVSDRVSENIACLTFRDAYGTAEPSYYQQRWNKGDEQTFPTVRDVLKQMKMRKNRETSLSQTDLEHLWRATGIESCMDKAINLLSSGELRRLQLAKVLLVSPQLLIVDNPYIGLDPSGRQMLTQVLEELSCHLTVILIVSRPADIPDFIQEVIHVADRHVSSVFSRSEYLRGQYSQSVFPDNTILKIPPSSTSPLACDNEPIVELHDITLSYDGYTILKDLNWTVRRGEHWALSGENGAGKSTLLSLICADNPAAYACDIRLFGCRRGHGESIWDIKRNIGFVSPELYQTYRKNVPAIDIVASGLRDTIGLYGHTSPEETAVCRQWLRIFQADHLAHRNFMTLSSGEQRLCLLVRAFVKSPTLLILDEPFHGLDDRYRTLSCRIIDHYMKQKDKTLIMVSHYENEYPNCIDHRLKLEKQYYN